MKYKLLIIVTLLFQNLFSQKVKVETGELNVENDYKSVISKVFNGKVYACAYQKKKVTIVGFEVSTMKQVVTFTTENISNLIAGGVLYMENKIVILHLEKRSNSNIFGDVFSYDGKNISKDVPLHNFSVVNRDGERLRGGTNIVSQNGKYLMLGGSDYVEKAGFEYALYDENIKIVGKGIIRLPKEHANSGISQMVLSNTGNIGIFTFQEEEDNNTFSYLRLNKGSKALEVVKVLSKDKKHVEIKLISSKDGYFIGGLYGTFSLSKAQRDGFMSAHTIDGAFGIHLDLDNLSPIYTNLTDFSADQAELYNNELKKHPGYKRAFEKSTPDDKIINELINIRIDGMTIDKNKNIILGLSSFERVNERNKFSTNIIVCQFRLNAKGGISNFTIIPKRNTVYNDTYTGSYYPSDYFFSSIVCSGNNIVSIFNDPENNISNLTDMNKNVSDVDKKSVLASAETSEDGKFKKRILLPNDKHVLILTEFTFLIDHDLTFAIATRDKGDMVLLKIISE